MTNLSMSRAELVSGLEAIVARDLYPDRVYALEAIQQLADATTSALKEAIEIFAADAADLTFDSFRIDGRQLANDAGHSVFLSRERVRELLQRRVLAVRALIQGDSSCSPASPPALPYSSSYSR